MGYIAAREIGHKFGTNVTPLKTLCEREGMSLRHKEEILKPKKKTNCGPIIKHCVQTQ